MSEHLSEEKKEKKLVDRHSGKKVKNKTVEAGKVVLMLVLTVVILLAGYYSTVLFNDYNALKDRYADELKAAEDVYHEAEAAFAIADSRSEEHEAQRCELTNKMIDEANTELEELEQRIGETEDAIVEARERLGALQDVEDYDYYRAIYDQYVEGREYVEELLSGN